MPEIRQLFRSQEEWTSWSAQNAELPSCKEVVVADIRERGFVEPFSGKHRYPYQIKIDENNLHESVSCSELNSRKRALLMQIDVELRSRGLGARRDLKILGAEGLTRIALILRGQYPFYLGSEYLPTQELRDQNFPIPNVDLQAIGYERDIFDLFLSADVLEYVPHLDRALAEILRILRPGGLLVSSFPFLPQRTETVTRASLQPDGSVVHHAPLPQGGPGETGPGSLVFQLPGWDILDKLRHLGCSDAYFASSLSSHFGVVSNVLPGPYILVAQKEGATGRLATSPANADYRTHLPEKLCTLIALPRSGTTVLTSMFAVHSNVEASYEPWNSKVLDADKDKDATIQDLAKKERLPSLAGKILFVKETAARQEYVAALNSLYESAPYPIDRHAIMLVRDPYLTLLSELDRRNEWWGDSLTLSAEFARNWSDQRGRALRAIIGHLKKHDGVVVCLEDFAERSANILIELGQRIGFVPEREQLEYEKHLQKKKVRGDLNVSSQPEPIDIKKVLSRQDRVDGVKDVIQQSGTSAWFDSFVAFHAAVRQQGGITTVRQIPDEIIAALTHEMAAHE